MCIRDSAEGHRDVVVLTNHYTCMLGGNEETFYQMVGICANPNVAAVLVLSLIHIFRQSWMLWSSGRRGAARHGRSMI